MSKITILLYDPDKIRAQTIATMLADDYELIISHSPQRTLLLYGQLFMKIRLILFGLSADNESDLNLISDIKKISVLPELIVYASEQPIHLVVSFMKAGAYHFMLYPFSQPDLIRELDSALDYVMSVRKIEAFSKDIHSSAHDLDRSFQAMQNTIKNKPFFGPTLTAEEILSALPISEKPDISLTQLKRELEAYKHRIESSEILIVEDEEIYRHMMNDFISNRYKTHLAENGLSAIKRIEKTPSIDLVLLDIFLPDMAGDEVLKKIKVIRPDVDVIIITAFEIVDIAIKTLKEGASDYLNKPILKDHLLQTIAKTLYKKNIIDAIPELGKRFFSEAVSFETKLSILTELCRMRHTQNKKIYMADIYALFPELRDTCIPDALILPDRVMEIGIPDFITDLRARILSFNPLAKKL